MRFDTLECHFGRLDGRFVFPTTGLALVLEENEQGKTTLVEALLAALYGYSRSERSADAQQERKRYLPLDGAPCYVHLELTAAGRRLSIRRDLDGGAVERVRVTDLNAALDVTAEFAPTKSTISPGERLTGLSRDQFLRVSFVRQGQVGEVHDAASLKVPVEKLVDTSAGERTANAAIATLEDAMRAYKGVTLASTGLIDTEIKRLDDRVQQARTEQAQLRRQRDSIDADARRLEQLEAGEQAAAEQQAVLALLADRAELARLQSEQQAAEEQAATRDGLRRQIAALEPYRRVPADAAVHLETCRTALTAAESARAEAEAAQAQCRRELEGEQARLDRMGAMAAWGTAERDELILWRGRLETALQRHAEAETAWQEALRNAGAEAQQLYRDGRSPFDTLSDDQRRTLQRYPQDSVQLRLRLQQLRSGATPASDAAGHRLNLPVLVAGGAVALVGLGLLKLSPAAGGAVIVAGLLIAVAGQLLHGPGRLDEAAIEARALTRKETADTEQRLQEFDAEAERLAALAGLSDAEAAAALLQTYLAAQAQAAGLRATQGQLQRATEDLAAAQGAIAGLWTRAGSTREDAGIEALDADRLLARVENAVQQHKRVDETRRALDIAAEQLAAAAAKVATGTQEWTEHCVALGLPATEPEAALRSAREMVGERQRLDQLEGQLHLLDEQARSRPAFDASLRIKELTDRIAAELAARPEIPSRSVDRAESDYRDEARAIQERRDAGQRERQDLRGRIGRVLEDYRLQMPRALGAEQTSAHQLAQVRAYRDALELALKTLCEVALESHQSWAETLNAAAAESLHRLAPHYAQIRFDDQLSVRVIDADNRVWSPADGQLSSGVRDRLYLGVRLALADYFSRPDDPLPLILDDPLVTSDDEQFSAAMRFILEDVATRHQVILTSCHGQRHRALMQQDPELWSGHAAILRLTDADPLRV